MAGVDQGGDSNRRRQHWRRELGRREQKRQWLRALAMVRAGSAVSGLGYARLSDGWGGEEMK